jgi:hypothetical protein
MSATAANGGSWRKQTPGYSRRRVASVAQIVGRERGEAEYHQMVPSAIWA